MCVQFFFFKQKTAYDVRISDWSSDVCSSDLRSRDEVAADYVQFPTPAVHAAFAALGDTDSATVDPHKLGYLPYGSGAFVCRDHRAMALQIGRASRRERVCQYV